MKCTTQHTLRVLAAAAFALCAQAVAQEMPESNWQAKPFRGADAVVMSGISSLGCGE